MRYFRSAKMLENDMNSVSVSSEFACHATLSERGQRAMLLIPEATVRRMRDELRAQTPDCITSTFGISMNTWTKVRDGQPIRRSVAERLMQRLGDPVEVIRD